MLLVCQFINNCLQVISSQGFVSQFDEISITAVHYNDQLRLPTVWSPALDLSFPFIIRILFTLLAE